MTGYPDNTLPGNPQSTGVVPRFLPLRTLIVDDSHEFLGRMEKWLSAQPGFEVVGKAYSGVEAVQQSRKCRPDLVVMDVAMPFMNGYEAAARIKEGANGPVVILVSFFDSQDIHGHEAVKADAFLMKDVLYDELLPTVARLFPQLREQTGTGWPLSGKQGLL